MRRVTIGSGFLLSIMFISFCSMDASAQRFKKKKPNTLYARNKKKKVEPVFVGIGTKEPSAQLHTVGAVRFQNLATSNSVTRALFMDDNGNLFWRDISTLPGGGPVNAWLLTGNAAVSSNFLGTINAENLRIRVNNTERAVITTDGFFGLGITNPTARFHTTGALRFQNLPSSPSPGNLVVDSEGNVSVSTSVPPSAWNLNGNSGTNPSNNFLGTTDNNRLVFRANNIEQMTILPNGHMGIGTSNPSRSLFIQNSNPNNNAEIVVKQAPGSTLGAYLTLDNTSNASGKLWSIGSTGPLNSPTVGGALEFYQQGFGTRMMLDENGRLGVAIGNGVLPTANLHTKGTVRLESLPSSASGTTLVVDANGNVFVSSSGAGNAWDLTGNSGTNPANNFLGTTDNNRLVFRANNVEQMTILPNGHVGIGTSNPNRSLFIQGVNTSNNAEIVVKQLTGSSLGAYLTLDNTANGNGNSWSIGSTGPLNSPTVGGILEFYQQGFGTRMLLDASGRLGVSIGNGVLPTANLHTSGTVRFQNLPTGTGNALVMDANGNVFKSNTLMGRQADELKDEIETLKKEIESLKSLVNSMKTGTVNINVSENKAELFQNSPNPFTNATTIRYFLPSDTRKAILQISDLQGKKLMAFQLNDKGLRSININGGELPSGTYLYSLVVNGEPVDSKKMILTR